jgi:hypothetical protein
MYARSTNKISKVARCAVSMRTSLLADRSGCNIDVVRAFSAGFVIAAKRNGRNDVGLTAAAAPFHHEGSWQRKTYAR